MSGRINENKSGRNVEQQKGVVQRQQQIYRLRFNSSRALFFLFLPLGLSSPPHPACWLYPSRMHFSLIDFHCCARAFLADAAGRAGGISLLSHWPFIDIASHHEIDEETSQEGPAAVSCTLVVVVAVSF